MDKKKVGIYIRETKRFIVDDKYVRNLLNCVESRKDWELVKIYRDMDHGYYPHLPEHMKEMIEDVAEGRCEIILITHLGIFGENRKFKIKDKILQRGGQVVYYHKEKIPKKNKGMPIADNAGCEELANAIIIQACKDYKSAYIRYLRRYGTPDRLDPELAELERFFRSDWYKTLTSVDGEYLMKRMREEVDESRKKGRGLRNSSKAAAI